MVQKKLREQFFLSEEGGIYSSVKICFRPGTKQKKK
jgi:hypothetical protein